MANYQEAVCLKADAIPGCILFNSLQIQTCSGKVKEILTTIKKRDYFQWHFGSKEPKNYLQRIMWLLGNAWVMTNMWRGLFIYFTFLSFLPKNCLQGRKWDTLDKSLETASCKHNATLKVLQIALSLAQRLKIKRNIWPTWLQTKRNLNSPPQITTEGSTGKMSNSHLAGDLNFFWIVWHPESAPRHVEAVVAFPKPSLCLYLPSFQRAYERSNLLKSTGGTTGFFCHCVSTIASTSPPPMLKHTVCCSTLLLLQPSRERKAVWEPVGKLRRRISGERGRTVFCLNGDRWNVKCSPDVIQSFWCSRFFPLSKY